MCLKHLRNLYSPISTFENQTLGGIFEGYRKRSKLPSKILDFIEEVYKRRNTEPNAAHGATQLPSIDKKEAAVLIEMTKAIARSEYW